MFLIALIVNDISIFSYIDSSLFLPFSLDKPSMNMLVLSSSINESTSLCIQAK